MTQDMTPDDDAAEAAAAHEAGRRTFVAETYADAPAMGAMEPLGEGGEVPEPGEPA